MSKSEAVEQLSIGVDALRRGDFVGAEGHLRRSIELDPDNPEAHLRMAMALSRPDRTVDAIAAANRAVELNPNLTMAHGLLSGFYQRQGKFKEAIASATRATEINPELASPYCDIVRCKRIQRSDEPLVTQMAELLNQKARSDVDLMVLNYALGKAHDDLGEFAKAIKHFDEGNRLGLQLFGARLAYDSDSEERTASLIKSGLGRETLGRLASQGSKSEVPIFIVGMIRSGTTLLDSRLSCHPNISSAGELKFWEEESPTLLRTLRSGDLTVQSLEPISGRFLRVLEAVHERTSHEEARVIDKFPLNYRHLGFIHATFPQAKFIHVRRSPLDTCLSIYTTEFGPGAPRFAYSKAHIVQAYRIYLGLMDHWRSALPEEALIEIDYEDLAADQAAELRKLIHFLGLEPAGEMDGRASSNGEILSPSRWQARQPTYSSSVGRWRNYEPWLAEFREL